MTAPPLAGSTTDLQMLWRMFALARPYRGLLSTCVLLYIPLHAGALAQPFLLGVAVDQVLRPVHAPNAPGLHNLALAYLAALLLQAAGQFAQLSLTQLLGHRVTRDLRNTLFARLQRFEAAWFDRTPVGQVMARFTQDVDALGELFASDAATLLGDALFLVVTAAVLWWTSPGLTLAAMALLPLLALGVRWFRQALRVAWTQVRIQSGALHRFLQEHLSAILVVQLLNQQQRSAQRFDGINHAGMMVNRLAIRLDAGVYAFVEGVGTVAVAVVLVAAAHETSNNVLSMGAAVAFVEYLQRFFVPVQDLATRSAILQGAISGAARVFELLDLPVPLDAGRPPPEALAVTSALVFEDVSFAYPGGTQAVSHVTFQVPAGKTVALVGHTGSGKTTLARLLLAHHRPQSGRVTLDQANVVDLDPNTLARAVLMMPQEVYLFPGSVAQNLRFGAPDATAQQLWQALEDAQARSLVEQLPGGLDALLTERGANLSLGQRQLLAFARALLANPPCIILDEATASVDPDTERRLQRTTGRVLRGRTALVIAHRLSTLVDCDFIVVLEGGRVVEQGTHAQLIAAQGCYARIHAVEHHGA